MLKRTDYLHHICPHIFHIPKETVGGNYGPEQNEQIDDESDKEKGRHHAGSKNIRKKRYSPKFQNQQPGDQQKEYDWTSSQRHDELRS